MPSTTPKASALGGGIVRDGLDGNPQVRDEGVVCPFERRSIHLNLELCQIVIVKFVILRAKLG